MLPSALLTEADVHHPSRFLDVEACEILGGRPGSCVLSEDGFG